MAVTDRGFINVDIQICTNVPHIFAIGDIVGQPMLAHKAVHEEHVAAEVIAGELQGNNELAAAAFNALVIPSVAYTDPEVAWVGLTEDQAKAQGIKVKKGLFPWTASGRAIANGRDEGVTKLLFDDSPEAHGHGKILGGGMVGTHADDMIGEIALAIEMGADAVDIGKTIHPHPTLGESIGMAAEVAHGRDGGTPHRPRLSPPAGAPVGAVGSQAAAVFHATRWRGAGHGAAHLPAGHCANAASQRPWYGKREQGQLPHRRNRLHPSLWLQPERTRSLSRLRSLWGV